MPPRLAECSFRTFPRLNHSRTAHALPHHPGRVMGARDRRLLGAEGFVCKVRGHGSRSYLLRAGPLGSVTQTLAHTGASEPVVMVASREIITMGLTVA